MRLHKEGLQTIIFVLLMCIGMFLAAFYSSGIRSIIFFVVFSGFVVLMMLILWFFRMPARKPPVGANNIICPADGKVVVIEKTMVKEFVNEERIQVSIFMSPLNVHAQWYPVDGTILNAAYHRGKHMVAWHPKSSELNERSSVLIGAGNGKSLLVRQIAGAVARRIVTYSKENEQVQQGTELGFIKFGSRVDVFLPLDAKINVKIDDIVVGNQTILAEW